MLQPRSKYLAMLCAVGVLGYWIRFKAPVPAWLRDDGGGAAYVMFWMCAVALLRPSTNVLRLALAILTITCGLEFLQLWHPPPLEAIRRTFPGRVILGTTFDWNDFPPYALGAILGWLMLKLFGAGSGRCPGPPQHGKAII